MKYSEAAALVGTDKVAYLNSGRAVTVKSVRRDGFGVWVTLDDYSVIEGRDIHLSPPRHPAGCSCGAPDCPEWIAALRGE